MDKDKFVPVTRSMNGIYMRDLAIACGVMSNSKDWADKQMIHLGIREDNVIRKKGKAPGSRKKGEECIFNGYSSDKILDKYSRCNETFRYIEQRAKFGLEKRLPYRKYYIAKKEEDCVLASELLFYIGILRDYVKVFKKVAKELSLRNGSDYISVERKNIPGPDSTAVFFPFPDEDFLISLPKAMHIALRYFCKPAKNVYDYLAVRYRKNINTHIENRITEGLESRLEAAIKTIPTGYINIKDAERRTAEYLKQAFIDLGGTSGKNTRPTQSN